ncbi:SCP2 sterol-binding domain-containing protein [Micromonospora sp. FIMYZ51]|uniref:SCP2 sterol-binding domain-containing protein n=1 Tax=Micromonospora sp. FIMYZ51 TaxID=3051832 RepID=UPI00311E24A1
MSEAVRDFFDQLTRNGGRLLRQISGSVRFDLTSHDGVDRWLVVIERGRIAVSHGGAEDADTVIRTDETTFVRMARGEVKPLPAFLRNDLVADGQFRMVILLERLFAPPPGARHPRVLVTGAEPAPDREVR